MANFIHFTAQEEHYYPKPNNYVKGRSGKHLFRGVVLRSKSNPRKAAVWSRWGYVGCFILTDSGRRVSVNEIRPLVR